MHRDVAIAAEHDEIFVLVIAIVADSTLSVFLDYKTPFVCT